MTLLPWHPPYDWQWMFHFLEARTVQGIETFVDNSYCRSFALNGHAGLIAVTPDDAAQGMRGDAFRRATAGRGRVPGAGCALI
ncbi:DNA-3-methyladenine glycosylase II [Klebsiella grimontii]|uniref:DNA-3-methyladenine glycosylase II n=1 Tax=Klebsiella grimontii TaxID=2058152 RepID=A0A7H4P0E6_9ENTR|nr:DNA-3-methyladenine glycosylase II [Klebsiella grimontii]